MDNIYIYIYIYIYILSIEYIHMCDIYMRVIWCVHWYFRNSFFSQSYS